MRKQASKKYYFNFEVGRISANEAFQRKMYCRQWNFYLQNPDFPIKNFDDIDTSPYSAHSVKLVKESLKIRTSKQDQ